MVLLVSLPERQHPGEPEMTHKNEHPALLKFIMEKMKGGIFRIIIVLNWPNEIMPACFGLAVNDSWLYLPLKIEMT